MDKLQLFRLWSEGLELKPRLSSGVTRKFHLPFFESSNRMGQIKISAFAKNPKQRLQDLALNMRTKALRAFFNIGICCFMIGAVYHEPKTLRAVCCSCQGSSLKRASNLYARKKTLCCSGRGSSLMAKTWCNLSSYSVNSHVHKQVEMSPAQFPLFLFCRRTGTSSVARLRAREGIWPLLQKIKSACVSNYYEFACNCLLNRKRSTWSNIPCLT